MKSKIPLTSGALIKNGFSLLHSVIAFISQVCQKERAPPRYRFSLKSRAVYSVTWAGEVEGKDGGGGEEKREYEIFSALVQNTFIAVNISRLAIGKSGEIESRI